MYTNMDMGNIELHPNKDMWAKEESKYYMYVYKNEYTQATKGNGGKTYKYFLGTDPGSLRESRRVLHCCKVTLKGRPNKILNVVFTFEDSLPPEL